MAKDAFKFYSTVGTDYSTSFRDVIRNVGIILCCLFGAIFLSEVMHRYLMAPQNLILIYVLAILVISVFTSYFYSIAGTLAGVIIYDYLIAAPRFGFSVTLGFPINMIIMLIVSLTTCTLVAKVKAVAVQALEANRKTEIIYRLTRSFIGAYDQDSLVRIAGEDVIGSIHRTVFFYLGDPSRKDTKTAFMPADDSIDDTVFADPTHRKLAAMFYKNQEDYCFHSKTNISYWKLSTGGEPLGIMCIAQQKPLGKDEQDLLQMIVVQMSIILEKINLAEYRQRAEIKAEAEQARSSLLRGISHDLRNPLTNILGAVSVLIDGGQNVIQDPSALELLNGIYSDTDWLLRMVENILTITRLQSKNMQVVKKMEAPEELIAYAVRTIRKRHQNRQIHIIAPEELILVPMDPILITQVVINFLENAVKHSPYDSDITVTLTIEEQIIRIAVADQGRGITFWENRDLFAIDPRQGGSTEDASRGMGMGLSICKTIVLVHGGDIGAKNNPDGGACFWFTLPLQAQSELDIPLS